MFKSRLLNWISHIMLMVGFFVMSGCARVDHKQSALDPKGLVSQNQYDVFILSVWITIFLFTAVGGALLFVLWKYRARNAEDAKRIPAQSHGNPWIEASLIFASFCILVILAIPTLKGIVLLNRVPDPNDAETLAKLNLERSQVEDALVVNVTGKRFFWVFEYPQYGFVTANELVFPVGKAVRVNLRTEDVIHSFWLPKLAGKMDLIPGQENFLWFIANKDKVLDGKTEKQSMPTVHNGEMRSAIFRTQKFTDEFEAVGGLFYGQCAEYCGASHAYMSFRALAQTDEDFKAWTKKFQDAQNPYLAPKDFVEDQNYSRGDVVKYDAPEFGANAKREYIATKDTNATPTTNDWKPLNSDDYEHGKQLFSEYQCVQCHAINRTGIGAKGPNLTLYGIRTSLAAGWMRNNEESLARWIKNSNEIKDGNLMWNGEGIDDNHPVRNLENEDEKVNKIVKYLLGQK